MGRGVTVGGDPGSLHRGHVTQGCQKGARMGCQEAGTAGAMTRRWAPTVKPTWELDEVRMPGGECGPGGLSERQAGASHVRGFG